MPSISELAQNERPLIEDGVLRVVDMNDDTAASLFKRLGDETTLQIYTAIQQEPKVASELTELSGTTIQNVHYHLNKLEDAGLIESVDTWVSETGKDMDVYGPTNSPLIISFSSEEDAGRIRSKISDVLGVVGAVSFVSLVVEYLVGFFVEPADPWMEVGAGGYDGGGLQFTDVFVQYPGLCVFVVGLAVIALYRLFISPNRVVDITP